MIGDGSLLALLVTLTPREQDMMGRRYGLRMFERPQMLRREKLVRAGVLA